MNMNKFTTAQKTNMELEDTKLALAESQTALSVLKKKI